MEKWGEMKDILEIKLIGYFDVLYMIGEEKGDYG